MVSSIYYNGDGSTRIFPVSFKILGDDYIRVYVDDVEVVDKTKYDIINNSVVFTTSETPAIGVDNVKIFVATSSSELGDLGAPLFDITSVANNLQEIIDVSESLSTIASVNDNEANINLVAANTPSINTVANDIPNVNTVAGWVDSGFPIVETDGAFVAETVEELSSIPDGYKVAIISDLNRGGTFIWSATGTANGGTVFEGSTGYWIRQYDGAVNVKWFGAVGDGITDDTISFDNALSLCIPIYIPKGIYIISDTLQNIDKYTMIGEVQVGTNARTKDFSNYSTIRFKPSIQNKQLINVYNITSLSDSIGHFYHENILFDLSYSLAGGLQFGLPKHTDTTYIPTLDDNSNWDTVVNSSGQRYIFGVDFKNCLLLGREADTTGQILLFRTKCFNSTCYKTAFYGGNVGKLSYGCDKPVDTRNYYHRNNYSVVNIGSGTFRVQHIEADAWIGYFYKIGIVSKNLSFKTSGNRFEYTTDSVSSLNVDIDSALNITVNSGTFNSTLTSGFNTFKLVTSRNEIYYVIVNKSGTSYSIAPDRVYFPLGLSGATLTPIDKIGNLFIDCEFSSSDDSIGGQAPYVISINDYGNGSIDGASVVYSGSSDNERSEIKVIGNSALTGAYKRLYKPIKVSNTSLWSHHPFVSDEFEVSSSTLTDAPVKNLQELVLPTQEVGTLRTLDYSADGKKYYLSNYSDTFGRVQWFGVALSTTYSPAELRFTFPSYNNVAEVSSLSAKRTKVTFKCINPSGQNKNITAYYVNASGGFGSFSFTIPSTSVYYVHEAYISAETSGSTRSFQVRVYSTDNYIGGVSEVKLETVLATNLSGNTTSRPTLFLDIGVSYYDTTLGKMIWYNGSAWKDATGTTV